MTPLSSMQSRRRRSAVRHGPGRTRGFTLVELMVGLAVGLFVSVIAISLFVSTRKLQTVNSASNRMAENARLAFDLLHKDLRLAGFRGCTDLFDKAPVSALNANSDFIVDANGVRGHEGGGSFAPALSTTLAGLAQPPVTGSDVISVRVPVDATSLALDASMAAATDTPSVGTATNGLNAIESGDIVLMSNCKTAVLFQVSGAGAPSATGLLPHAVGGTATPGNATLDLGAVYNRADTAVYRMQTRHYYVAPTAATTGPRAGTRSLWRLTVPGPAGTAPIAEEVVPGIERLDIAFGLEVDAVPDRAIDRYVEAGAVGNWDNVLSARIQMLAATTDNGTATAAASVQFAGGTVAAGDRRLREVFTEVVAFRNLMP